MARILIAKLGLDSHWRGALTISRYLRDKGHEVIFIGNQTPDAIVEIALQEDVNLIGLSTLAGNHMVYVPEVMDSLKKREASDIPVILGGIVPEKDRSALREKGVNAIFGPGESMEYIGNYIETACHRN